ncbi:PIN domain-containing protein [Streptomyces sp. NPDC057620]|uniref:PIN domain-containing protein n=1 Tax=Streptomyces sp. NPDC057620 TaxID=3346185 RepID=UPI003678C5CB
MIILDTCILEKVPFDSTSADLLKTIGASKVDVVAVPEIVMSELVSHRAVPQREKHEKAVEAFKNYKESSPWPVEGRAPALDFGRLDDHWRKQWGEVVSVVETSADALREAFRREAMLLEPCKRVELDKRKYKIGGRDAAIWLTAVEYARNHRDETVIFVSANTNDFGDGSEYPYPMDRDVAGLTNFVHLTTFSDLISRLAVPRQVDDQVAYKALSARTVARFIQLEARMELGFPRRRPGFHPLECTTWRLNPSQDGDGADTLESIPTQGFVRFPYAGDGSLSDVRRAPSPRVKLSSVRDVKAHEIGGHVWCSATARWLISGLALEQQRGRLSASAVPAATTWETRVLFSPTHPDSPMTVLRSWPPKAATAVDFREMPTLPSFDDAQKYNQRLRDRESSRTARWAGASFVQQLLNEVGDTPMEVVLASLNQRTHENLFLEGLVEPEALDPGDSDEDPTDG